MVKTIKAKWAYIDNWIEYDLKQIWELVNNGVKISLMTTYGNWAVQQENVEYEREIEIP